MAKIENSYNTGKEVVKVIGELGLDIVKEIPVIGSFFKVIDNIASKLFKKYKEEDFLKRAKDISEIFDRDITFDDDLAVLIARISIKFALSRKDQIINGSEIPELPG